jgi:aminoglycoside phosphotransferase (APT) family kinase protein
VRQPSEDRALYYRQLRRTVHSVLLPELTSAQAIDTVGLVDRILAEFIVEEEAGAALSAEFGAAFEESIRSGGNGEHHVVSPLRFHELREEAAGVVARTAGSIELGENQLGRQLVAIERDFLERVEALRQVVLAEVLDIEGEPSLSCSVGRDQLTEYLRRRLPDSPDVLVEHLSLVPGGRSKETIRVSLSGTRELPDQVILRKDRPVGLLQTKAAEEFAVIKAVHDFGGVPVPEPYFAEPGGHELGEGSFLIMEFVRGRKAGEFFPDLSAPLAHQVEIGRQLAASLARLHSLPVGYLRGTNLDVEAASVTEDSIRATVQAIVGRIDELTGPSCAAVYLAQQWLLSRVSDVVPASRLCLLQGDFGFHNMLVDGAEVTALVDWEAAAIGPPARELAAAWGVANTLMPWADFIESYIDAGGQPEDVDPGAVRYYRVLSALGGFMTSKMGGHLFRSGTKRDLLTAHSGLDSNFRCARNLTRALDDAISSTA